jgi:hypothetical protein
MRIYNFWDCNFKDGIWKGEDIYFCDLARESGFKIYANIVHHSFIMGPLVIKGTYKTSLK